MKPWPFLSYCCVVAACHAGPFPPGVGLPGSDAISRDDPRIVAWATAGEIVRGSSDISSEDAPPVTFGSVTDAVGSADATFNDFIPVVSLGDGGEITLTFGKPISNGTGPDFAVFENGFNELFLELGFVEVSSNGADFFRFPAVSLTPSEIDSTLDTLDPTDLHNLAGKYPVTYGTPFDLSELPEDPRLDKSSITHVRVIDVVGSNDITYGSLDSQGNLIIDPFPTPFPTGGFDLDAIGVIHEHPSNYEEWLELFPQAELSDLTTDFDGDGIPNGVEYFAGTDPTNPRSQALRFALSGDQLSLDTFQSPLRSDVSAVVEQSISLDGDSWKILAESTNGQAFQARSSEVMITNDSGHFTFHLSTMTKGFYRIRLLP